MEKEELKKVVISQAEQQEYKYINRRKSDEIEQIINHPFVLIITGIRRCGKSTILNHIRKKNKESNYYLNFDDNRLISFEIADFEKLYEVFLELFGVENRFYFDEIQNIEGWERFVRRLHNEGKKVMITGSSASMLSKELGSHLTGRNIQIELFPFSFKEFLELKKIKPEMFDFYKPDRVAKIMNLFKEYLEKGGFPEYLLTENKYFLQNIFENILYRDVVARYNLFNEKTLKEMVHFLISNISKELSFSSIKKVLGLASPTTVKEYINYFENSYLLFTVNRFDYSLKKQIVLPKKIYSIDTGLANAISFKFSENLGRQLENVVYLQLKRRGKEIYYHKNKNECDFVIKEKDRIVEAIQVSVSLENESTKKREIKGLLDALDSYNLSEGIILTNDEELETEIDGKKIFVKPVWKWLLEE